MTGEMIVIVAVGVMSMRLRFDRNGNEVDLAVRDPALRNDGLREFAQYR
jgi:hypothetical protein